MCHTTAAYYLECGHTDFDFVLCCRHDQIPPEDPVEYVESEHRRGRPRYLSIEWRDHTLMLSRSHSYYGLCPWCARAQRNRLMNRWRALEVDHEGGAIFDSGEDFRREPRAGETRPGIISPAAIMAHERAQTVTWQTQYPRLRPFIAGFPSSIAGQQVTVGDYDWVAEVFFHSGYADFLPNNGQTLTDLMSDILDCRSRLWRSCCRILDAMESVDAVVDWPGRDEAPGWTLRQAQMLTWIILSFEFCIQAYHETQAIVQLRNATDILRSAMRKAEIIARQMAARIETANMPMSTLFGLLAERARAIPRQGADIPLRRQRNELRLYTRTQETDSQGPSRGIAESNQSLRHVSQTVTDRIMSAIAEMNVESDSEGRAIVSSASTIEAANMMRMRAAPMDPTHVGLNTSQGSSTNPSRNGLVEAECNTLVAFEACGHYNAVRTEKLTMLNEDLATASCGCSGFTLDAAINHRANSKTKCLMCIQALLLPEQAFGSEEEKTFANLIFARQIERIYQQRDIDLWPLDLHNPPRDDWR